MKYKHMVQDLTVSQSLIRSFSASLWNIHYIKMNGCVKQREREGERERESCYVSPRQERFLIHVHKAYFQEIWRGDSFILVSVSSGKPSGINNELLHLTKKSFIFSLRFVVNAEKKIMRCVSVYVIG